MAFVNPLMAKKFFFNNRFWGIKKLQSNYRVWGVTHVEPMLHLGTPEAIRKPLVLPMFSEAPKMWVVIKRVVVYDFLESMSSYVALSQYPLNF